MPSKKMMVFLLVLVAAGIYGGLEIDRRRDVPHSPPGYMGGPGVAVAGGATAKAPDEPGRPVLPPPVDDGPDDGPPKPDPRADGKIRPTGVTLQPVNGQATVPVQDPGTNEFTILKLARDGEMRWSGIAVGSYEALSKLCEVAGKQPKFQLVIAPDHLLPWKNVYWVLQIAQANGIYDVGIGCTPTFDPDRTLLAMLKTPLPRAPYVEDPEIPELRVSLEVEKNGGVTYTIHDQVAEGWRAMMPILSGFNSEYAGVVDKDYSRDPSKTPWVLVVPPDAAARDAIRALEVIRLNAIYTVRFGAAEDFPEIPK